MNREETQQLTTFKNINTQQKLQSHVPHKTTSHTHFVLNIPMGL